MKKGKICNILSGVSHSGISSCGGLSHSGISGLECHRKMNFWNIKGMQIVLNIKLKVIIDNWQFLSILKLEVWKLSSSTYGTIKLYLRYLYRLTKLSITMWYTFFRDIQWYVTMDSTRDAWSVTMWYTWQFWMHMACHLVSIFISDILS